MDAEPKVSNARDTNYVILPYLPSIQNTNLTAKMKLTITLGAIFTLCLVQTGGTAQNTLFGEDFGTGCNQGQSVTSYANGWSVTNTGANEASASNWYVSGTETNTGVGNCGAECGSAPNPTLHVSNPTVLGIPEDIGAAYYEGLAGFCGFFPCGATDKRVESPLIDCTGHTGIVLSFTYLEGGNTIDNATVWYFDGSVWTQVDDPPKTFSSSCSPQGEWSNRTISLPASANNNPGIRIAFRWINNDDGDATDPSFAADDILVTGIPDAVEPTTCLGDFNGDGEINATDFSALLGAFGCQGNCSQDVNGDNQVDTEDLLFFLTVFGTECD